MEEFKIGDRVRIVRGSHALKFGIICSPLPHNKRDSTHVVNGGTAWVFLDEGQQSITVTLPKTYLENLSPKPSIRSRVPAEFRHFPESILKQMFRGVKL